MTFNSFTQKHSDFVEAMHEGLGKKVGGRHTPITPIKGSWADETSKKKLKESDSDSGVHPVQHFAHELGLEVRSYAYGFNKTRCLGVVCSMRELAQLFYNIGEANVKMGGSRSVPKFMSGSNGMSELFYFPDIRFVDKYSEEPRD